MGKMNMQVFQNALARVAVWNLAGFGTIDQERMKRQAQGLAYLDAELVTLVEVNPLTHIYELAAEISQYGIEYDATIAEQDGNLHTGFLFKKGVKVSNLRLIEGSQGNYARGRKAVAIDVKIGKFNATIIGVHLKAGRDKSEQRIRDTQCQVIGKWINTLRATPGYKTDTIVLMGDFNMISKDYVRGSLRLFPMHWTMDMGRERFKDEVSDHLPFTHSRQRRNRQIHRTQRAELRGADRRSPRCDRSKRRNRAGRDRRELRR